MGYLLLLSEQFRLKRNKSQYTLKATRFGNRREQISKLIEAKGKFYATKTAAVDAQATATKSSLTAALNTGNIGMLSNILGGAGALGGILSGGSTSAASWIEQQGYTRIGNTSDYRDSAGGTVSGTQVWTQATSFATTASNQLNALKGQIQVQIDQYIEAWKTATKEGIKEEEELAKEPLNLEDTKLEIEQNTNDTLLEYTKSRLEAIESQMGEEVKDAAPKFGLS